MSQIFKSEFPSEKLMTLLEGIAFKHKNYYLFNNAAYKKGILDNSIVEFIKECIPFKNEKFYMFNNEAYKKGVLQEDIQKFLEGCKEYYHISKQKYLEKKISYNTFVTIMRQICNFNKITYTSQIKYDKSLYNIDYYIYFDL